MATGVKPRDEDTQLTRSDLEALQDAMKHKNFREMLSEYCEEIRDPANQAIYQKEMTHLEKERGYDVTFLNPKAGYVIKTSVAGDRKAFINICSNENIEKPTCRPEVEDGRKGLNWQLPYSIIPPREDYNNKKERCVIYDVVFHPDTLRMAYANKHFRDLVNKTAFEGLQKTYGIHLDNNNIRFPKSYYKGMALPAVIRKEDPNFKPPEDNEDGETDPELLEKLYPQHTYEQTRPNKSHQERQHKVKSKNIEFAHTTDNGYTIPKYVIKQQKNIDLQEYTYHKDSKKHTAIPSHIVVEINLPLLSSTKECILDVSEKQLILSSEKPAKYKLNIQLPYSVNDNLGNAKFDITKHLLIVTLPVIERNIHSERESILKTDSGVDSEEMSGSHSEEESKDNLIKVLVSSPSTMSLNAPTIQNATTEEEEFLLSTIGYTLPSYTFNMLDEIVAFTFHVKNTDPESVIVSNKGNVVQIKFSSIGSGYVPVHYAAKIVFAEGVQFISAMGEAWDNNVILQLEVSDNIPTEFEIGLTSDCMKKEILDVSQIKVNKKNANEASITQQEDNSAMPLVEVTNLGRETNILVSSSSQKENIMEECFEDTENEKEADDLVFTETNHCVNSAKSILRKPIDMKRTFSESSYDVASSMDYISSDCIPEESSLKKTVRFSDVIARQFYRKSKKRSQERQKSESEAEEDYSYSSQSQKTRPKSALKQRRDSGLADTSDAEVDNKGTVSDSEVIYNNNCNNDTDENSNSNKQRSKDSDLDTNEKVTKAKPTQFEAEDKPKKNPKDVSKRETSSEIKHNTDMYNPDKLNKGRYQEVKFKNDLIFDLDM
ncbi:unnamed protein product [Leptidea sinapis]|uniref:Protein kintoun n=1 Tax=Leptidea sinapis TaxID=189913 RepID=A0A5E4Q4H4_9NEOP|nr:unnamed protein product [Leptidea sinapis]